MPAMAAGVTMTTAATATSMGICTTGKPPKGCAPTDGICPRKVSLKPCWIDMVAKVNRPIMHLKEAEAVVFRYFWAAAVAAMVGSTTLGRAGLFGLRRGTLVNAHGTYVSAAPAR